MELIEGAGLVMGGGVASFAGAFAAVRVHIAYMTKQNDRQDERLSALEKAWDKTDRKADRAHLRLDHMEAKTA